MHIHPLALSSMSSEKPGFLSNNVMEQMEAFLHNIVEYVEIRYMSLLVCSKIQKI